jgi:K(+)-stimulated pyrophosphate-energized sodium pump
MDIPHLLVPLLGLIGLGVAGAIFLRLRQQNGGTGRVAEIAAEIHSGAMIFMKRELRLIALFALVVGGLLINVRTTLAAHERGPGPALTVAFFGGSVMGLTVASLGLLGLGALFPSSAQIPRPRIASSRLRHGRRLVALFFRVGGGIFTKAADVGADLVGKVEAGIPEDDPRNPGVIADNVGDNVGDVAGMGSDIFESYCGAMIATMAIAATVMVLGPVRRRLRASGAQKPHVPAAHAGALRPALLDRRHLPGARGLGQDRPPRCASAPSTAVPSSSPWPTS